MKTFEQLMQHHGKVADIQILFWDGAAAICAGYFEDGLGRRIYGLNYERGEIYRLPCSEYHLKDPDTVQFWLGRIRLQSETDVMSALAEKTWSFMMGWQMIELDEGAVLSRKQKTGAKRAIRKVSDEEFARIYREWKSGNMKVGTACELCGLARGSFYSAAMRHRNRLEEELDSIIDELSAEVRK